MNTLSKVAASCILLALATTSGLAADTECHFPIRNQNGNETITYSTAKRFIYKNWILLEENLALSGGKTLDTLNGISLCGFNVNEDYWPSKLKGIPLAQRIERFQMDYQQICFCQ